MAHEFTVSEFGLKLIKAYEGFRRVETTLVSGQRVIGYGHRHMAGEEGVITEAKAEALLKDDLLPYAEMINESVHAPLTQSQFDALLSLAFNIGPKAFLDSNVLHALNNGRPLDAASGFDEWRKSTIEGRTYVVDALVRRRTAEKALFLRPALQGKDKSAISAPRNELPPEIDRNAQVQLSDTGDAVFGAEQAKGIVDSAPYAAQPAEFRRKDDGPAGVLTLSEIVLPEDAPVQDDPAVSKGGTHDNQAQRQDLDADTDTDTDGQADTGLADTDDLPPSPIAAAAAEVSERLDRLIADNRETNRQRLRREAEERAQEEQRQAEQERAAKQAEMQAKLDEAGDRDLAMSANIAQQAERLNGEFSEKNILPLRSDTLRPETLGAEKAAAANDGLDGPLQAAEAKPAAAKPAVRGPDAYIQKTKPQAGAGASLDGSEGGSGAYWTALVVGGSLLGGGAMRMARGNMDELTAFLAPAAACIGAMIVTGAVYYIVKNWARSA